jgi:hypothetical protein
MVLQYKRAHELHLCPRKNGEHHLNQERFRKYLFCQILRQKQAEKAVKLAYNYLER